MAIRRTSKAVSSSNAQNLLERAIANAREAYDVLSNAVTKEIDEAHNAISVYTDRIKAKENDAAAAQARLDAATSLLNAPLVGATSTQE